MRSSLPFPVASQSVFLQSLLAWLARRQARVVSASLQHPHAWRVGSDPDCPFDLAPEMTSCCSPDGECLDEPTVPDHFQCPS